MPADNLSWLMIGYQSGDPAAFDQLYRHLLAPLRRYLISLTLNVQRAEDLLQETFLQLHRSRHTYRPPRPVRPWAFGIARHVFLMDRRAAARKPEQPAEDELLAELEAPGGGGDLAGQDLVRRAVAQVPRDHREALLLHHVWGFSFKEIAHTLGIRETAAKVRAHRGMARLRQILGAQRD